MSPRDQDMLDESELDVASLAEVRTAQPNPYTGLDFKGVQDDFEDFEEWGKQVSGIAGFAKTSTPTAPRTSNEAAAFLLGQHRNNSTAWRALCLKLQRMARGLPGVYPSAIAAAEATPKSERIRDIAELRRGMVAYSDSASDGNPFGHIYYIIGRKPGFDRSNPDGVLTWTNDALGSGQVDMVPLSFYSKNWGDPFQFGATWLNGYDFSEFNAPPKLRVPTLGENYEHAMDDVRRSLRYHEKKGHTQLVKALQNDLERMERKFERFGN